VELIVIIGSKFGVAQAPLSPGATNGSAALLNLGGLKQPMGY
jgi:hypothetical protein